MAGWVGGHAAINAGFSVSVTLPAGAAAGNVALLAHGYNQPGGDSTITAGWTLLDTRDFSASFRGRLYYRILGAGEGGSAVTLTNPVSQKLAAAVGVLSGVSAVDLHNFRIENTVTTSHTAPSLTAGVAAAALAFILEREGTPSTAFTPPSGFTLDTGDAAFNTGSGATSAAVAYNLTTVPAGNTVGGGAWGSDVANDALVMWVVSLAVVPTATPDNATQAQTASEPAVTFTPAPVAVAPASAVQAQTASSPAVTFTPAPVSVAPADAQQAQTASAPAVTYNPPLTSAAEPRSPFLIEVWDGTSTPFVRAGRVGSYTASEVILRDNLPGSWRFTLSLTDGGVNLFTAPGRRVTIDYRGRRVMSGPAFGMRRARSGRVDEVEVYGYDDLVWLNRRLAFPNPLATFPADGVAFTQPAYRDVITDNAETMIKHWVTRNCVTRLPVPGLTVATDQGRGASKSYGPRWETVLEACARVADLTSLSLRVNQVGGALSFDVSETALQPVRLSRSLGNLVDWEFTNEGPKKTRNVAGLDGEDAARRYMLSRNTSSEAGWGITESFYDTSGETDAERYQQSLDDLTENAPTYAFSVVPRDTESMRFGETYNLGDRVVTELFPDVTLTDKVRQVTITDSVEAGTQVKPIVGDLGAAERSYAVYLELRKLRAKINKFEREK